MSFHTNNKLKLIEMVARHSGQNAAFTDFLTNCLALRENWSLQRKNVEMSKLLRQKETKTISNSAQRGKLRIIFPPFWTCSTGIVCLVDWAENGGMLLPVFSHTSDDSVIIFSLTVFSPLFVDNFSLRVLPPLVVVKMSLVSSVTSVVSWRMSWTFCTFPIRFSWVFKKQKCIIAKFSK